ncbi:hypothetical protein [Catenovulum maritimum]|uniref:Uncharacterized protein n=1 Tax=Catenovulum maritimum TaxID=1513271 RepID=A0A0J8GW62_9ALTE|nr:hypothetical protein [Catenovulum maritimum]KMT64933.1 hypothetical protein XM47_12045 [Catenovulum maritimum]
MTYLSTYQQAVLNELSIDCYMSPDSKLDSSGTAESDSKMVNTQVVEASDKTNLVKPQDYLAQIKANLAISTQATESAKVSVDFNLQVEALNWQDIAIFEFELIKAGWTFEQSASSVTLKHKSLTTNSMLDLQNADAKKKLWHMFTQTFSGQL